MPTEERRAEHERGRDTVPDLLAALERSLQEARDARDRKVAEDQAKRKDCCCG